MADQLNLDTDAINRFTRLFEGLKKSVKEVDEQVVNLSKTLTEAIQKMETLGKSTPGKGGSKNTANSNAGTGGQDVSKPLTGLESRGQRGGTSTYSSHVGTPQHRQGSSGTFWNNVSNSSAIQKAGAAYVGGRAFISGAAPLVQAAGDRNARGAEYALSSDRLNLQTMVRTGMNHQDAQATRKPLRDFRLGGIEGNNTVLQQSMRLNTNTEQTASFYAHQRAMTGYGRSTADAAQSYEEILRPEIANQMQRNLGVSPYKIGGGLKDPAQVQKELYQKFNLGDDRYLQSGKQLGSMTRAAMAQGGLGEKQQDELFLFAESQNTFAQKGGKGTLDLSRKDHRELLDIEDTYASQSEQTELEKSNREERFADRHMDHFEVMEENQQKMVKLLGNIESALTPAIGFGIKNKPFSGAAGGLGSALGLGLSMIPGARAAGMAVTALSGMLGGDGEFDKGGSGGSSGAASGPTGATSSSSGSSNDGNIKVPTYNGSKSISEVKNNKTFKNMHPNMQTRMLNMMREGKGKVGFGEGLRDSKVQERMFLDRYRPDPSGDVTYQGKQWKRVKGAPAAPPGRSMHEIGLAADLISTDGHKWMNANAHRFGLKHFANVNNEPWHVQPAELPNSRRKYEDAGAPWGTEKFEDSEYGDTQGSGGLSVSDQTDSHSGDEGAASGMATSGLRGYDDMNINEIAASMEQENLQRLNAAGSGGASESGGGSGGGGDSVSGNYLGVEGTVVGADAAARAAYAAGFRGSDLASIVAIAGRESGWSSDAMNPNTSDTGMWQINFSAHKSWLKNIGVTKRDQLKNLSKNAEAAAYLFKSDGWKPWRASASSDYLGGKPGWDPDGNHLWKTDDFMSQAQAAASSVDASGDAVFEKAPAASTHGPSQSSRSNNVSLNQPINVTVSPTINVSASNDMDLDGIAATIASMLEHKVRELNLRSS